MKLKQNTLASHQNNTVVIGERVIPYTLRQSARARSVGFSIRADTGLVVTLPQRCAPHWLDKSFKQYAAWILKHYDRIQATAEKIPQRWPYGTTLPYLGTELPVELVVGKSSKVHFSELLGWQVESKSPSVTGAKRTLKQWYVKDAQRVLKERVDYWAECMQIDYNRVTVRAQKSRWGSCSEKKNISLNYVLIMAPLAALDYVVIHELTHCIELSHSRKFWAGVAQYCPDYRVHKKWLSTYGPYLGIPE